MTTTAEADTGLLRLEMEDEDIRCREDVKRVAYETYSGGDPKRLQQALDQVLSASKERQAALLRKYGWGIH